MSSPKAPAAPAPPPPPDYAAANKAGVEADISTLAQRNQINIDSQKQAYEELGPLQAENLKQTALAAAQADLQIQQQYGSQFNAEQLKRIQESDPIGYQLRQSLAQNISDELGKGYSLSPDQSTQLQQQIRGAQAARGNILGNDAISAEALYQGQAAQNMFQQRLANAASYVQGTPITSQYGAINSAQGGAAPFMPQAMPQGTYLNPNAGAQGAQFASSIYGNQTSQYGAGLGYSAQMAALPNPWMEGIGMAIGVGTKVAGAAAMCWVAREVYGKANPKWQMFRYWLCNFAPKWLLNAYIKFGPSIAEFIRNKPRLKNVIRIWMDNRIEGL